jgi:hypothetical protein
MGEDDGDNLTRSYPGLEYVFANVVRWLIELAEHGLDRRFCYSLASMNFPTAAANIDSTVLVSGVSLCCKSLTIAESKL